MAKKNSRNQTWDLMHQQRFGPLNKAAAAAPPPRAAVGTARAGGMYLMQHIKQLELFKISSKCMKQQKCYIPMYFLRKQTTSFVVEIYYVTHATSSAFYFLLILHSHWSQRNVIRQMGYPTLHNKCFNSNHQS